MPKALEPCFFEYLVYLVKEQGEFSKDTIEEISDLWQVLAGKYGLDVENIDINTKIQEAGAKIYLDKTVKVLETKHTPDNIVWLRQSLAHDTLIITFLLNSPEGTVTEEPWVHWDQFNKKISKFKNELSEIFYQASVLQTIVSPDSEDDTALVEEYFATRLSEEFEPFKKKKISMVELPSGKLWRYGINRNFLFTLTKDQEESANLFLANEFPYIISLLGKIENHYVYAVELYEALNEMERTTKNIDLQLVDILPCNDISILENKRDEINTLGKSAIEKLSSLRICGNNIKANIKNISSIIPKSILDGDNFITETLSDYSESLENIKSWSDVGENILMRITKYIDDTKEKLTDQIQKEQIKVAQTQIPEAKSIYSPDDREDNFETDVPQYSDRTLKDEIEKIMDQQEKGPIFIEWGTNYLFFEEDSLKCYELFNIFCSSDYDILCITRQHPDKLKNKFEIKKPKIKLYWLSTTACEYCMPPTLTRISHEITKFIREANHRVILLDGLEFLVNHNDYLSVLKFMDNTKENIILKDSILLIPISPYAFSPKELSLVKKNMNLIGPSQNGYDFTKLIE